MKDPEESDYKAYEDDLHFLINTLKESFESDAADFYADEFNDTLYIKLEGLQDFTEDEIEEIASPIFDLIDLDFEEIVLLPL